MSFLAGYGWVWFASLSGFLILWPISVVRRDASVVDFWWGPGFGVMAVATWLYMGAPSDSAVLVILIPLLIWSTRLGLHLGWRRIAEGGEDPRYGELRNAWGPQWWWKSLFVVFVLQAVLQGLIAWGVLAALPHGAGGQASWLQILLALLALGAVGVESAADLQLDAFRRKNPHGGLMTSGLRSVVRHPNYTAEMAFWILMGLIATLQGIWWAGLSGIIVVLLLRYVSGVTIIDERMQKRHADYAAYRRKVPALLPGLRDARQMRRYAGTPGTDQ